jgi:hypothetical protein
MERKYRFIKNVIHDGRVFAMGDECPRGYVDYLFDKGFVIEDEPKQEAPKPAAHLEHPKKAKK